MRAPGGTAVGRPATRGQPAPGQVGGERRTVDAALPAAEVGAVAGVGHAAAGAVGGDDLVEDAAAMPTTMSANGATCAGCVGVDQRRRRGRAGRR